MVLETQVFPEKKELPEKTVIKEKKESPERGEKWVMKYLGYPE